MKKVRDLLDIERDLPSRSIYLHEEGLFYRAYERSAYYFHHHIKAYELKKQYFKNVGKSLIYLGFPSKYLARLLEGKGLFIQWRELPNHDVQLFLPEDTSPITLDELEDFKRSVGYTLSKSQAIFDVSAGADSKEEELSRMLRLLKCMDIDRMSCEDLRSVVCQIQQLLP